MKSLALIAVVLLSGTVRAEPTIEVVNQTPLRIDRPRAVINDRTLIVLGDVLETTTDGETLIEAYLTYAYFDESGARLHENDSCGWVQRTSWLECRTGAGVFDISRVRRIVIAATRVDTIESVERQRLADERQRREQKARIEAEEQRRVHAERATYRRAVESKRLPKDQEKLMLERRVWIGMSAELLRLSWGAPTRITETTTALGKSEVWTYGTGSFVTLMNGRVTSITQSR